MISFRPTEKIFLIKRKHPIVLKLQLIPLFIVLFFVLSLILILFVSNLSWPDFYLRNFPDLTKYQVKFLLIFVLSLFFPIFWGMIFLVLLSYLLTYWIVTNQRLIFIRLKGLFNVEITEVTFDKIQDVSVYIKGILPSLFHFGDIRIQTAGEGGQFYFTAIPDPQIVKQIIFEAKLDFEKIHGKNSH